MHGETFGQTETFAANVTAKRFLALVNAFVHIEIAEQAETFLAHIAFIFFIRNGVCAMMGTQIRLQFERLIAHVARVEQCFVFFDVVHVFIRSTFVDGGVYDVHRWYMCWQRRWG